METILSDTGPNGQAPTTSGAGRQTVDLTIKVVDQQGQPVANAKVEVHSDPQITLTDDAGIASFTNLSRGKHQLYISYKNYRGQRSLNLTDDTVKEYKITIEIKREGMKWLSLAIGAGVTLILLGLLIGLRRLKLTH